MLRRPWLKSWKSRRFPSRSAERRRVPLGLSLRQTVDVARYCSQPLEDRTLLATITWDGGGDGSHWSDPLNWSSDVLPGAADDVTINFGSNTVQHDTGTDTVNSPTTTNPFELAGGTLSVVTTTQVDNSFRLNGGTLSSGTVGSSGEGTRREKECRRNFSPLAYSPDTLLAMSIVILSADTILV